MRSDVRARFIAFTAPLEGVVRWLYLDVKGLVTIAIGNLVDPIELALGLPMVHKGTDIAATAQAIRSEWTRVKEDPNAARLGHRSLEAKTSLRLTDAGVEQVVGQRLELNDTLLRTRFDGFDDWPADAQLATHSMSWACGPAFRFPRLEAALRGLDFARAANECQISAAGNPGIVPRNFANRALYIAAASPDRNDERVTWDALTKVDAKLWPARAREPSVVTPDQLLEEAPIVHPRVPLPDRD